MKSNVVLVLVLLTLLTLTHTQPHHSTDDSSSFGSLSPQAEWNRIVRRCTPLNGLGNAQWARTAMPLGRTDSSYARLCHEKARAGWQVGAPIVLVSYTDAFVDALFHRKIDGLELRCEPEFDASCQDHVDDAMRENFGHMLCPGGDGMVPCATSRMAPLTSELNHLATIQRDSCRRWGLQFDCVVQRRPFAAYQEGLLGADGVLFDGVNSHLQYSNPSVFPKQKCGHQYWVFHDWRSVVNYPLFADRTFMSRFDITAGYSRNYTIWGADMIGNTQTAVEARPSFAERRQDVLLAFFISNCDAKNDRLNFIRQLTKHLPAGSYHSFGKCLTNAEVPRELKDPHKYREKARVFAQYKFALAIENANDRDYVTEKVWDALSAGAIPVYGGAPNVNDFVPDASSIVNMDDFASPADLAAHLVRVGADEQLYNTYHAWRFNETVLEKLREVDRNHRGFFECKVCDQIAKLRQQKMEKENKQ